MKSLIPIALALMLQLTACMQLPTEKQEVADLRPQLSFSLADPEDDLNAYRVYVDGLDMGSAASYLAGKNGMKVLSGSHELKVEGRGRVVLQDRIYLGDRATRTIIIPRP
jgi:hypothetical protein